MKAVILAPGPSLGLTCPKEWLDEYVVAVTDGIFASAPIRAWSFQEGPNHKTHHRYQLYGERVLQIKPDIWCVKGAKDRWVRHWDLDPSTIRDEYDINDLLEKFPYEAKSWRSTKRKGVRPYAGSSAFYAIARLIAFGFKEIHLYGVDMDGPGNFDPRDGKIAISRRAEQWWNDRWRWEKDLLMRVTKEAGKNGIEIVKHEAEYDIDEARAESIIEFDGWL